ncbi:L,D-transpeptidase family protein [Alteraurantiacibacter aquimixticola]|uniref:L,D-transpeptidase n=1 Tax=Alteraurantiacibacter aquimixticola TaxID=2489173 RepID=A0A4T3F2X7_9SPHN|nr:L,D-transpeptidase family protein [Alteraurantiacibacter aquimixticola]TIX51081.1 L,D-transpeptidase [Alteraurantiacibacter aquimixticola]
MREVASFGILGAIALGAACAAMPVAVKAQDFGTSCADVEAALPAVYMAQSAGALAAQEEREWTPEAAQALLELLATVADEGLNAADYRPEALRAALADGESERLDNVAGAIFGWLVQDLRDGRTPRSARRSFHVVDPDARLYPASALMARVKAGEDVGRVLASLDPVHPDYAALRDALGATPLEDVDRRRLIAANMDRWRWLPRDLGATHLLVNIPEFRLRLMVDGEITRSHRVIVGIPGRNATPQFSDQVEGIIFNPTWTVPQSIVVGEGLGRRVLNNPAWARSRGYVATRGANGYVSIVQQPGPQNALGIVKLDMPNPHAVFLHDTPAKQRFEEDYRALSHGCIRTQDVLELAFTLVTLNDNISREEAQAISDSGTYTRVPLAQAVPVHIAYFTMGVDENGEVTQFADLYDRDAPVLQSMAAPVSGRRLLN